MLQPHAPTSHAKNSESSPRKIMVIDDEPSFTRLVKLNLEATGRYVVKTENDPTLALPCALEFRPDLILADVMMPGMDGGDVARAFSAHSDLRQIPIVFLTATVRHSEVRKQAGQFGGFEFLAKPIDIEQLLSRLEVYFKDECQTKET